MLELVAWLGITCDVAQQLNAFWVFGTMNAYYMLSFAQIMVNRTIAYSRLRALLVDTTMVRPFQIYLPIEIQDI
jgi:hypothetical protein